ncbi:MAG: response regulator transcription factor [Alphaproteobacteria bacterium]|nr:response regulator transcription factor [Alphaproteobacteria bacterium]
MARILLIDDDIDLLDVLALAFEDHGHSTDCAEDGAAGLERIRRQRPDLVVSDVNMPRIDGFTLCRRLREAGDTLPLILLTSRDNEIDEALGLELGADDYVPKPFNTRILLARVHALLRRQALLAAQPEPSAHRSVDGLTLDADRLEVRLHDAPVQVTVTEFRLLEALTSRPGVVFSRDRLMEMARGDDSVVAERIIDTYVRRLRRKFEAIDAGFEGIETVIGAGYRWRDRGR